MQFMGSKDPTGRNILFVNSEKLNRGLYERESLVRAVWYVLHAAIEDETTQKLGVIFVAYPKHTKSSELDFKLNRMVTDSLQGCVPLRVSKILICKPPRIFAAVWPIVRAFLPDRVKKRVAVHGGTDEKLMQQLEKYKLTKEMLPTELGGTIELDHAKWVSERKQKEEREKEG
mmetsp:Transcript_13074/g.30430  ORF Transcript_13074/g.30430 Transcript_13074/m.30430 type:complete len:173 (-) Transcript_13074:1121-1639(-)